MGYRIDYQPVRKLRNLHSRRIALPALTGMFFLLFLFVTFRFSPGVYTLLLEFLIPGENAETVAAFNHLCQDLKENIGIKFAVQSFFRQLFGGGF